MSECNFDKNIKLGGLWIIIIFAALSMFTVSFYDAEWTVYLRNHNLKWFSKWMSDSIFEGEMLGGDDFSTFLMIFAGIVYLVGYIGVLYSSERFSKPDFLKLFIKKNSAIFAKLSRWYPQAGFVLFSGLFSSVYLVQALKWMIGRARPNAVIGRDISFTNWFDFGPYFIGDGYFRGSFPSGHTAAAAVLMALGYVFLEFKGKKSLALAFVACSIAAIFSFLMLIARSMTNVHWVSDSIFSFFAAWLIIHISYFFLFDIPKQRQYFLAHGHYPEKIIFFELLLALSLLLAFAGISFTGIGVRAAMLGDYKLIILIFIGLTMIVSSVLITRKLLKKYKIAFDD